METKDPKIYHKNQQLKYSNFLKKVDEDRLFRDNNQSAIRGFKNILTKKNYHSIMRAKHEGFASPEHLKKTKREIWNECLSDSSKYVQIAQKEIRQQQTKPITMLNRFLNK